MPVVALLVLAPWTAECSWGGFPAVDFITVVVFLGPMYGGAAVLIREVGRRTGGGWPAIMLLATAFGFLQAGLVDQSMFNPDFLANTQFAESREVAEQTLLPVAGFSAGQAFVFVGNHIALSICTPIAIVEAFVAPDLRYRGWLRWPGWIGFGVLYIGGSLLVYNDGEEGRQGFVASPGLLVGTSVLVLLLAGLALLPRWHRERRPVHRRAPRPIWVGLTSLVAFLSVEAVPGWPGFAGQTVVVAAAAALIAYWSRGEGFDERHVLAAWAAGLLLAGFQAYLVPTYQPASEIASITGDIAISVVTLSLLAGAYWRLHRYRADQGSVPEPSPAPGHAADAPHSDGRPAPGGP
jgi:hypothetical protein